MIEIIANTILEVIKMRVIESKYYSVECDQVTSHQHFTCQLYCVMYLTMYPRTCDWPEAGS